MVALVRLACACCQVHSLIVLSNCAAMAQQHSATFAISVRLLEIVRMPEKDAQNDHACGALAGSSAKQGTADLGDPFADEPFFSVSPAHRPAAAPQQVCLLIH